MPCQDENEWKSSVQIRDKWKYQFSDELEFPRIVQFQTTSHCNASCIMCPYGNLHDQLENGFMEDALIDKIINECREQDPSNTYEFLPYLMGEPSLDRRLPKIILKIKERLPASAVSVYTNGSLDQLAFWNELIDAEPDSIVFSINSLDQEEYRRITGGLSLTSFLEHINYVQKSVNEAHKKTELITHVLRMGKEADQLLKMMKFWGDKHIACRTAYVENRSGDIDIDTLTNKRNYWSPQKCWRLFSQIHILFDGRVVLCCNDWKRKVILGNVKEQTLYEIWNSEQYKRIREGHRSGHFNLLPSICRVCNISGCD